MTEQENKTLYNTSLLDKYPCLRFALVDVYQRAVNTFYDTDTNKLTPYEKYKILKPYRDEINECFANISFNDASNFDAKYFNIYDTHFWGRSYDYPIEGSIVNNVYGSFRVTNVGLLTFGMKAICDMCNN